MKRVGTRNVVFFTWPYHKIMKLKCKARRYLSLFSCNCVSHMTNYVNFKLSEDVVKNPGPTQYNTDHHEVIDLLCKITGQQCS